MNIGKYLQLYSEDLQLKNYASSTIENYCSQVRCFLEAHKNVATKPSEINERQIKSWLLQAKSINGRKHRLSAIKLFYSLTGKQPLKFKHIEYPRAEKKLPQVLSQDEIKKMFAACQNLKHKAILSLLYSVGLRVSELINLQWSHIDRSRGVINIYQGKGNKDRQVPLSTEIIPVLEKYYLAFKPVNYVFNGQNKPQYSETSVRQVIKQLAEKAGIDKKVWTHLIRHCSFTHMVEHGTDINIIQHIAGHSSPKTTKIYTHLSHNILSKVYSPITGMI